MELVYWPSKWGLPSIDLDCLYLLTYIQFSNKHVKTTPTFKSLFQRKGRALPVLRLEDGQLLTTKDQIIDYLRDLEGNTIDQSLDVVQQMKLLPMKTLVQDQLYPAVIATLWLDNINYAEVVRPAFARNCRYPLNFTIPKKMRDSYENDICTLKSLQKDDKILKNLVEDAVSVLRLFSELLGTKEYLLGDQRTSLDALFFSCIAPLSKIPFKSGNDLIAELKNSTNLNQYVKRILLLYKTTDYLIYQENSRCQSPEDKEEEEPGSNWFFPVSVAVVAMFSYAVNIGLLTKT